MPKNTIDMIGDGDDVGLVVRVENAFGIQIAKDDAEAIRTVGDLYKLVCKKVRPAPGNACLSATAFRRFRDAAGSDQPIRPATSISALKGNLADQHWCRNMSRATGLAFEQTRWSSLVGWIFVLLIFIPPTIAIFAWAKAGFGALTWLLLWFALPLFHWAPAKLPDRITTAGDLIKNSMGENYRKLAEVKGPGNEADIWWTVCGLTRDVTGFEGRIDQETTFFSNEAA